MGNGGLEQMMQNPMIRQMVRFFFILLGIDLIIL